MKTFIADIIPKIQRYSQRLDDLTKLTNQHWVSLGDITQTKRVFIFRGNNQLLISENGVVEKGSWEYLGNQSLLLETKNESFLLKHGFFDETIIALKLDSTDNYAFFVNETKYHTELNSISDILSFLENKYIKKTKFAEIIGVTKQNIKDHYIITRQCADFSFKWGNHTNYLIKFTSKKIGYVYKGAKSGNFFWCRNDGEIFYVNYFDDAVFEVYKDLHK